MFREDNESSLSLGVERRLLRVLLYHESWISVTDVHPLAKGLMALVEGSVMQQLQQCSNSPCALAAQASTVASYYHDQAGTLILGFGESAQLVLCFYRHLK